VQRTLTVNIYDRKGSTITESVNIALWNATGIALNTTGSYINQSTTGGSVTFYGIPDGVFTIAANTQNYTNQNMTFDTSQGVYTKSFYLLKNNYGYVNVTVWKSDFSTKLSGASVSFFTGSTNLDTGNTDSSGNIMLGTDTTVYNSSLAVAVSLSGYSGNTTSTFSLSNQEVKNVTVVLTPLPAAPAGPSAAIGGGGGGGPSAPVTCTEDWVCGSWTACLNNRQSRVCTDRNSCGSGFDKPVTSRSCRVGADLTMEQVSVAASECVVQSLLIRNTGNADLTNAETSGASVSDCCSLTAVGAVGRIEPDRTGTLNIRVCAPKEARKGTYQTSLTIVTAELTKSLTVSVQVTKSYSEVLGDQISQLRSTLNALDTSVMDPAQLEWLSKALALLDEATSHLSRGDLAATERAIQNAQEYLDRIQTYTRPPADVTWVLIPLIVVLAVGLWYVVRRRPDILEGIVDRLKGYPVRLPGRKAKPSFRPREAFEWKPAGEPARYDRKLLLKQVNELSSKVGRVKATQLGTTDRYHYDKAKARLGDVQKHIEANNLNSARKLLNDVETHLKVLESRLLSWNILKKSKA
jgi:hypothetical protein